MRRKQCPICKGFMEVSEEIANTPVRITCSCCRRRALRDKAALKYIKGIVERATGEPVTNDTPVTTAILDYVKSLEAARAAKSQRIADLEAEVEARREAAMPIKQVTATWTRLSHRADLSYEVGHKEPWIAQRAPKSHHQIARGVTSAQALARLDHMIEPNYGLE